MKTDIFPLNYFNSIWGPVKTFRNRFKLNWFQLLIVLLFLNGLMSIPITLNYATTDLIPLDEFYPNAVALLDEEIVSALDGATYEEKGLEITEPFVINKSEGLVAGGDIGEYLENETNQTMFLFDTNQFYVIEEGMPVANVFYTTDFMIEEIGNQEELRDEMSRQWFNQNRIFVVLVFSLMISAFFFVMMLLLVVISAFFLFLTKKSNITSITTYKESVNFILNALGIPTLVSVVIMFFYFDVTLMVTLQTFGLVIMLLIVYWKTFFKDKLLEE